MPEPPLLPTKPATKPMGKKQLMWYGAAGVGALAVVWWIMRRRSGQVDPALADPGYSPIDGGGNQQAGYYDPATGAFIGGVGATGVGNIFGPATNAAWAQQAEAYLTSLGYESVATATALGKYLTGQTMTSDQASTVQAALAFFGAPPTAPPPVSTSTPPGQSSSNPYPPLVGPGFTAGSTIGGYWWTPQTQDDIWHGPVRSGTIPAEPTTAQEAMNASIFWAKVMAANPQIDWTHDAPLGTAIYIPVSTGYWGHMPTNASLNAPATYHPPGH